MISRKKLDEQGFQNYQIEEIFLAVKNGVDEDLINKYLVNVDLDNLQMIQVRKGLQDGLDVSLYARNTLSDTDMEHIRLQLLDEKMKKEEEQKKKVKQEQRIINKEKRKGRLDGIKSFLTILLILTIFAGLGFAGYLFRDTIAKYFDVLELELSDNSIELEYGTKFDAEDYVVKATDGEEIIQIWPSFTADELGEFDLQYVITNNVKAVKKHLKVKVVDTTEPLIKLSEKNISLTRDVDDFNGFKYIDSVSDNYDPSPKVEIEKIDWTKRSQDIEYKVTDSSGNTATALLKVEIKNKPQTAYTPPSNNNDSSNASSSNTDTQPSSNTSSSNSSASGSSSSTTSESYTIDYEDYQPSNNQYDVTITNNNTGDSTTVSGDNFPVNGSDEEIWNAVEDIFNPKP